MKKIVMFTLCVLFFLTPLSVFATNENVKEETVYATKNVNIRKEPSTDGKIITVLKKGSQITRTGETEDRWSVVLYEGKNRYISSKYLSVSPLDEEPPEKELPKEKTASEAQVTEDRSTPRLMLTGYELDKGSLSPGKKTKLRVTFKNYSAKKALYNIKFQLQDSSGEILTVGMPTKYVSFIGAGSTYTWEIELTATNTAQVGTHDLQVSAEYEDKNYGTYSSSDTVRIDVRQSVKLDYDGAVLPVKVVQGDTQTVSVNLMNTGKSVLYNCKIDFEIDGLDSGGSVFVGEIQPGESNAGNGNLRVSTEKLGKVKGKITIYYEDDFGKAYEKTTNVSTLIEKKAVIREAEEEEKEKKNTLWWLFLLIGLLAGGGSGFGVMWYITDRKQRKDDDLRL